MITNKELLVMVFQKAEVRYPEMAAQIISRNMKGGAWADELMPAEHEERMMSDLRGPRGKEIAKWIVRDITRMILEHTVADMEEEDEIHGKN